MAAARASLLGQNVKQRALARAVWPLDHGDLAGLKFGIHSGESAGQAVELSNRLSTDCVEVDAHDASVAGLEPIAEQEVRRGQR